MILPRGICFGVDENLEPFEVVVNGGVEEKSEMSLQRERDEFVLRPFFSEVFCGCATYISVHVWNVWIDVWDNFFHLGRIILLHGLEKLVMLGGPRF